MDDDMDLTPDEVRIFRAIKKTAAVYLLLLRLGQPVGELPISRWLEMDPETARIHLNSLGAVGLVKRARAHAGWRLTALGENLLNSENAGIPATTTTGMDSEESSIDPAAEAESFRYREARQALRDSGIGEPTASRVAAHKHVSGGYVRAHALRARQEGAPSDLLVHRIRVGDPAPQLNERGHLPGCTCDGCQRDKYRIDEPAE